MAAWEQAPLVEATGSGRPAWEAAPLVEAPSGSSEMRSPDGTLVLSMAQQDPAEPTLAQQVQASLPGRIVQGVRDPLDAVAQMAVRAVPAGVRNAVNDAAQFVNDLPVIGPATRALGMTPATPEQLDQQIRQNEAQYQGARSATDHSGLDIARLGGNVLATLALGPASAPAVGAGLAARMGLGAASGAAFGGLQPVLQGDFADEKLQQMGVGALTGGAGGMVGNALARLVSPRASTNPQVQTLLAEGVTPTPGQMLGGTARTVEDKAISVPILGDAIRGARQRGIQELNTAALNRVTAPLGQRVTATGREGMQQANRIVSDAYDTIVPRLTFRADQQFAQELGRIQQMAQALPPDRVTQFQRILDDKVIGRLTPQGAATGQNFREIESELGRLARNYVSSPDADQRTLGAALLEIQTSLRDALARANPQAAGELGRINEAYALLTRVQRAAASSGADSGLFTPSQLSAAVRASDSTIRKNRFARGEALMQDLSDAGRSVLNSTIPNSGTADRLFLNAGALGTGLYSPLIPMGLGAASIPYLSPVNRLAALAIARRPDAAPQVAEQIGRIAPALGILASPAAYQGASN
ncbi:hypothetical protein N5K27_22410 [Pigmentiphaga sp. GD03639]|uniref:hypothetical protein n=1 Tax=Pigmentiphaga sp. GD03639 TaxID=2975354 RepID=UPI0024495269|nr:hypothetical protein [Pigmentiphaga sp. GD03639]MDH2239065.1 hypothetical protein [Pigmentiphaga sp. GD03639]